MEGKTENIKQETELQYSTTNRGCKILLYKCYEYVQHRANAKVIHWRCRGHQAYKCKSMMHTKDNIIIKPPGEHTHDIAPFRSLAHQATIKMKNLMNLPGMTPSLAFAEVTQQLSEEVKMSLPKKATIMRMLQRKQRKKFTTAKPSIPMSIDVEFPPNFSNYILYDSGADDSERIIIFGKQELLNLLERNSEWIADGTFKIASQFSFRLYTIHVQKDNIAWPCILALLTKKTQETYIRLLNAVKDLIPEAFPTSVITDLHTEAMAAYEIVFPHVQVFGGFFHLTQAVQKKMSDLGLKPLYEDEKDHSFAINVKMLCALSLLPSDEVLEAFFEVSEHFPDSVIVEEFLNYFETTYIRGRQLRNGERKPPIFPIEIWNHHDSPLNCLARTMNCVEGWHFSLQSLFHGSKVTMWSFLNGLVREIEFQYNLHFQYFTGQDIFPKKKYRDLKKRLEQQLNNYNSHNRLSFLKAIAHVV